MSSSSTNQSYLIISMRRFDKFRWRMLQLRDLKPDEWEKYLCDKTTDYRPINSLICPDSQWFYLDLVFHRVKYLHSSPLPIGQKGFCTCQIFTKFQAEISLSPSNELFFKKPDGTIFGEFHQFRPDKVVHIHKKTVYPESFICQFLVNTLRNNLCSLFSWTTFLTLNSSFLRTKISYYYSASR